MGVRNLFEKCAQPSPPQVGDLTQARLNYDAMQAELNRRIESESGFATSTGPHYYEVALLGLAARAGMPAGGGAK